MDIILVSHKRGRTWRVSLTPGNVLAWLPLSLVMGALFAFVFSIGFGYKAWQDRLPVDIHGLWADEISEQRDQLASTRKTLEDNTEALARRLAQLHAHVIRLDAAGARLTEVANLRQGEFNFSQPPPIGGPETEDDASQPFALHSVFASLDQFEEQLAARERQMRVLEDLLLASRLQKEVKPSGWPIEDGWISSAFGLRMDPFTGRRTFHAGVDFAAVEGSNVLAVASGIVTDVGTRLGYGMLVEINHGNGYVTRYGHNRAAKVAVGDTVRQGQTVALTGSSGRSTGPHVHFEVMLNGKVVNPAQYVHAAR